MQLNQQKWKAVQEAVFCLSMDTSLLDVLLLAAAPCAIPGGLKTNPSPWLVVSVDLQLALTPCRPLTQCFLATLTDQR